MKTKRMRYEILLSVLAFCIAAAACRAESQPSSAYKLEAGPYSVGVRDELLLHDKNRDKDLPVKIYYPEAEGPFPVIIFSHGAGGSKDGYENFGRHWASHGYVSIHPTHADSVALRRERGEKITTLRDVVGNALTDSDGWQNRPKDISFIIDSFGEIERKASRLEGKLDAKRIGVGGHSYGAFTSQVIGGATIDIPKLGKNVSLRDDRVKAVILMSPQGKYQMGLGGASWEGMKLPMMSMTGSLDRGAKGQTPEWRMEPYNNSPPGDKYHVYMEGANHFSFSGRIPRRALLLGDRVDRAKEDRIYDYVKIATTAFWDAYLKGEPDARKYLQSDALEEYSKDDVKLYKK
jgi:predicted dienelactone hydrolase